MNKKVNQNFIEEIEKNSKIFAEKINKLNSSYESENSQKNKNKNYKFAKRKNINKKYYDTENNYEENPFKNEKVINIRENNKRTNKKYDLELNNINNYEEINRNKEENIIYKNTIDNSNHHRRYNFLSDLNDEYILNNNPDKQVIEELRQTIIQKTNLIKLLKTELESKNKLPTQDEYDELNFNYDKTLNELISAKNTIKTKDEEINILKMKYDSILAQNKNMKGVINKKESELEKLKSSINSMKDELKSAKNKMNEEIINQKQISRDYEMLNQKQKLLILEKDKLDKDFEEKKVENFNLKKENIQLKKLIDKLKKEIKTMNGIRTDSSKKSDENMNKKDYIIYDKNFENQELINRNKDNNNKIISNSKIKNNTNKNEPKNINKENSSGQGKNRRFDDTEEKIIYNNDDDGSQDEDNSSKEQIKQLRNKLDNKSIKRNLESELNSVQKHKSNPINRFYKINEFKDKGNNNEYIALIKYKDKIIGCNREKIKLLIKEKEYQIVEKEINVLIKEKEKIENELLKIPEKPRKLNDIKNKKEINDAINKIESDIYYIRTLLKNTDDYYIN